MAFKVLILDYNPFELLSMKDDIEELNCDVSMISDGLAGLELIKKNHFNLIVVNSDLPVMTGYAFCKSAKEIIDPEITKILLFTENINAVDAFKAKEAGADDFCLKTHSNTLLLDLIKNNYLVN